ncbi:MAG: thioredoxin domain-containing protein [Solirubrobacterales bacterium]|nr:thioredoxin domain-containing protein [Solirubrobacterales bacterium]
MSPVESDEEDLTRKQRRGQSRSERKALEEAEAAGAARRKRLTQLGVILGVVVVAIVIVLIATGGGSTNKGLVHKPVEKTTLVKKVEAEVGGIPQHGFTIGASTAPVTMQYFGDLECPICKDFSLGALPSLLQKWVRAGKLRIEYRSLETATREPEVFKTQQVAALSAGKQNKMWQYIELFYNQQGEESSGYVTEKYLQGLAQQIPSLNLAQWTSDRGNAALSTQVATDAQTANNEGFNGTPSFLLGKTGGKLTKYEYTSLTNPTGFNEAIEKLLKA